MYLYFKALHLIFMVTWFAGLFYTPRLFIYQIENLKETGAESTKLALHLKKMAHRLWYIICWPGMILTLVFGTSMLIDQPQWLSQPWMHIKLGLLLLLVLFHLYSHQLFKNLQKNRIPFSSQKMRLYNEIPTVFLFAIIFLAVFKNTLSALAGFGILAVLMVSLFIGVRLYKKYRNSK